MKTMTINTDDLRGLRAKYKMNQENMAEILGISIATYQRKENGDSQFSLKEAYAIANFFEKSIDDIFHAVSTSSS
ncbi:helix-turn-helix transcriptional regulator [Fusibacter sp. JL216-2]|uniref:helix-turn-helix transcriptional regulator n=1 Tax=Fusibacter sp. JL216-2 TaxID=3071453 RepID=UPI003D32690B